MNLIELAACVSDHLRKNDIDNVLTGGSCAVIYSKDRYMSMDLDFVDLNYSSEKKIADAMEKIGFKKKGIGYRHPDTEIIVEILSAPLSIGEEKIEKINEVILNKRILKMLTPTDCVKDRLAAFYFWNDRQSLEVSLMVAEENKIDLKEIKRWSISEGMEDKFNQFKNKLKNISK